MTAIDLQNSTIVYDQPQARDVVITVKNGEGNIISLECVRDLESLSTADVINLHLALQRLREIDNDSCESVNGDTL